MRPCTPPPSGSRIEDESSALAKAGTALSQSGPTARHRRAECSDDIELPWGAYGLQTTAPQGQLLARRHNGARPGPRLPIKRPREGFDSPALHCARIGGVEFTPLVTLYATNGSLTNATLTNALVANVGNVVTPKV